MIASALHPNSLGLILMRLLTLEGLSELAALVDFKTLVRLSARVLVVGL